MRHIIASVRAVTRGRILLVFGAGGDRDRAKRPLMARAATAADEIILTSDNPRSEDPYQIIDELLAGFQGTGILPQVQIDRQEAILQAIARARPDDAVIIAGKGHEKVQILGERQTPFDDVAVCRSALQALMQPVRGMHLPPSSLRVSG